MQFLITLALVAATAQADVIVINPVQPGYFVLYSENSNTMAKRCRVVPEGRVARSCRGTDLTATLRFDSQPDPKPTALDYFVWLVLDPTKADWGLTRGVLEKDLIAMNEQIEEDTEAVLLEPARDLEQELEKKKNRQKRMVLALKVIEALGGEELRLSREDSERIAPAIGVNWPDAFQNEETVEGLVGKPAESLLMGALTASTAPDLSNYLEAYRRKGGFGSRFSHQLSELKMNSRSANTRTHWAHGDLLSFDNNIVEGSLTLVDPVGRGLRMITVRTQTVLQPRNHFLPYGIKQADSCLETETKLQSAGWKLLKRNEWGITHERGSRPRGYKAIFTQKNDGASVFCVLGCDNFNASYFDANREGHAKDLSFARDPGPEVISFMLDELDRERMNDDGLYYGSDILK
ncbi:MAG: hypothetical protein HYR96_03960 [Deltaproteobacteria bacterium]|nr:hypothetical protein [Deltaproteobacteria bacterium]MBI3294535.1 hypothetical protein [Deltaproteobacteria bacterium]